MGERVVHAANRITAALSSTTSVAPAQRDEYLYIGLLGFRV